MSRPNVSRIFITLVALVAVMLVAAASASAAGKPIVKNGLIMAATLSQVTVNATVNPNGAATKFYYEYKSEGETTFRKTPEEGLGSGTSPVLAIATVSGINANSYDTFRIVATNSFGTTTGAPIHWGTDYFFEKGVGEVSMPLKFAGTATISVPSFGFTISCQEHGYGSTGGVEGAGDYYTIELTKCTVSNLPKCTVSVSPIHLGGNFESTSQYVTFVDFDELYCGGLFDMNLPEITGFINGKLPKEAGTQQSFSLTDSTTFGTNPVTITLNTTWELQNGHKFTWGENV
jgi:hypothetical protein